MIKGSANAPSSRTGVSQRNPAIDMVKGMAITLVVFGHTLQGLEHRGWWDTPASRLLNDFIYSFHMPAFFLVSGLLVAGSLAHRTPGQFLAEKSKTILYPYLLWLVIRMADQPLTARFRSGPSASPLTYILRALMGNESWFLQCLFLVMVLALLTARLPDWLRALVAVTLCVAVPPLRIGAIDQVLRYGAFFALGQLVGARISALIHLGRAWSAAALLLLAAAQLAAVAYLQPRLVSFPIRSHALFLLLGTTGTIGLFCAARLLDGALVRLTAWTGEASIAIFLLHPYLQGAARELLLVVFHTQRPLPHLALCTLVGTLGSGLLWQHRKRLRIGWLFRWGRERARKKGPATSCAVPLVTTD